MGRMLAIASGKGGVGKSTVAVQLAAALQRLKRRVLLVDCDFNMRCLDLMLGLTNNLAFDISDLLMGSRSMEEVLLHSNAFGVTLLPAPLNGLPVNSDLPGLWRTLTDNFDFVLLDLPAGALAENRILPSYCEGLVVSNTDKISLRDAEKTVNAFQNIGVSQVRLVVNRVTRKNLTAGPLGNLDSIIDYCHAQLVALIPESQNIQLSAQNGQPLKPGDPAAKAFERFAKRITGYYIPLTNKLLRHFPRS